MDVRGFGVFLHSWLYNTMNIRFVQIFVKKLDKMQTRAIVGLWDSTGMCEWMALLFIFYP
ncbi:hypothetical protein TRIP_E110074 [uncultured Spirochaetota bacterium]|nr:hypothetical protein TRIP_E110074 [uncultured Spirochaetota bacterium]